jgi:hypothetical protein
MIRKNVPCVLVPAEVHEGVVVMNGQVDVVNAMNIHRADRGAVLRAVVGSADPIDSAEQVGDGVATDLDFESKKKSRGACAQASLEAPPAKGS